MSHYISFRRVWICFAHRTYLQSSWHYLCWVEFTFHLNSPLMETSYSYSYIQDVFQRLMAWKCTSLIVKNNHIWRIKPCDLHVGKKIGKKYYSCGKKRKNIWKMKPRVLRVKNRHGKKKSRGKTNGMWTIKPHVQHVNKHEKKTIIIRWKINNL